MRAFAPLAVLFRVTHEAAKAISSVLGRAGVIKKYINPAGSAGAPRGVGSERNVARGGVDRTARIERERIFA